MAWALTTTSSVASLVQDDFSAAEGPFLAGTAWQILFSLFVAALIAVAAALYFLPAKRKQPAAAAAEAGVERAVEGKSEGSLEDQNVAVSEDRGTRFRGSQGVLWFFCSPLGLSVVTV